jgi:hypothetical protein
MNARKLERYHQCCDKKDSMYAAMDKHLGFKEKDDYKTKLKKESAPVQTPDQCKDCKFKINMCYIKELRYGGANFICKQKMVEEVKK